MPIFSTLSWLGSAVTFTCNTSMRGSQSTSDSCTWVAMACMVAVFTGSKTKSLRPAPKSGRITRSPGLVPRMIRTDWATSASYSAMSMLPALLTSGGKLQPIPRKAFCGFAFTMATNSASYHDRGQAGDDRRATASHVTHAGGGQAADQHGRAALGDRRWRMRNGRRKSAGVQGAYGRGRQAADEHGRHSRTGDDAG